MLCDICFISISWCTLSWVVFPARSAGATARKVHYRGGESNEEDVAAHGHPSQGKHMWITKTHCYNQIYTQ